MSKALNMKKALNRYAKLIKTYKIFLFASCFNMPYALSASLRLAYML
jgi:hypothetical protein